MNLNYSRYSLRTAAFCPLNVAAITTAAAAAPFSKSRIGFATTTATAAGGGGGGIYSRGRCGASSTTMNLSSSSLPNKLRIQVTDDGENIGRGGVGGGSVNVVTVVETNSSPAQAVTKKQQNDNSSSSSSSSNNNANKVLLYERQLRKVQANQRSLTKLTIQKH